MPSASSRETVPYSKTTLGPPAMSDHEPSPSHKPRNNAALADGEAVHAASGIRFVKGLTPTSSSISAAMVSWNIEGRILRDRKPVVLGEVARFDDAQ